MSGSSGGAPPLGSPLFDDAHQSGSPLFDDERQRRGMLMQGVPPLGSAAYNAQFAQGQAASLAQQRGLRDLHSTTPEGGFDNWDRSTNYDATLRYGMNKSNTKEMIIQKETDADYLARQEALRDLYLPEALSIYSEIERDFNKFIGSAEVRKMTIQEELQKETDDWLMGI